MARKASFYKANFFQYFLFRSQVLSLRIISNISGVRGEVTYVDEYDYKGDDIQIRIIFCYASTFKTQGISI
jgi:hypothetical protein